jgi:antirestriction protein ArdC
MSYRKPTAAQKAQSEERRNEVLAKLADGIDRLTESDEWQRYLDCQSKFHNYSFHNTLLILSQRPDATQVASFKKWQELERHVVKGESSIRIFAPSFRKEEVEREGTTEEVRRLSGFRMVPVFDVSQTDGKEMPEPVKLLDGQDPQGIFGKLEKVAESVGFSVQVTPEIDGHPGANGLCEFGLKQLTVAGNRSELQQVKSLAHEIGHALLHDKTELSRGAKELEAESTAYVVCQSLGLDTSDYSLGYVAEWSGGDPEKTREAIKASGTRIHEASKTILDGLEAQAEKSAEVETVEADRQAEPELEMA